MSDKKIKHFIFTRFFTFQRKTYPYNVLETDFLSKQLPLAKNMLRSLENQTNKNFESIFLTNPQFFDDKKYEFIFSTLRESTTLPVKFVKAAGGLCTTKNNHEIFDLLKDSWNVYDFVITSRMDFDDFIYKDAVEDTQNKVNDCENILVYGYNRGYSYVYGELYPRFCTWWLENGHDSMLQSLIVKTSAIKGLPYFSVEDFEHPRIKPQIKQFLEKNNFAFSEKMFKENHTAYAYIYFRHDFSQEQLAVHGGKPFKFDEKKKLTAEKITKKQLEEEFGFHLELKSIK